MVYTPLVPIVMVASVLLFEYLITLFAPLAERVLFFGKDQADLQAIRNIEEHLLTRKDLQQFLELVLSAVCDRLQSASGVVLAFNGDGLEKVVSTGHSDAPPEDLMETLTALAEKEDRPRLIIWQEAVVLPLYQESDNAPAGAIVVAGGGTRIEDMDAGQIDSLDALADRAAAVGYRPKPAGLRSRSRTLCRRKPPARCSRREKRSPTRTASPTRRNL